MICSSLFSNNFGFQKAPGNVLKSGHDFGFQKWSPEQGLKSVCPSKVIKGHTDVYADFGQGPRKKTVETRVVILASTAGRRELTRIEKNWRDPFWVPPFFLPIFWSNHDPLKDFVYLGTVAILAQGKQSG